MQCTVDITYHDGVVSGYSCDSTDEYWKNYLYRQDLGSMIERIQQLAPQSIAVLSNINVEHRNRGTGTQLMNMFLEEAAAHTVILCADLGETQDDGFDLPTWYHNLGFVEWYRDDDIAFMVLLPLQ